MLAEHLSETLRDAAVSLAVYDYFVNDIADIIHGRVTDDRHDSGSGIDFNLTNVTTVGNDICGEVKSATLWSPPFRSSGDSRLRARVWRFKDWKVDVGAGYGERAARNSTSEAATSNK